MKRWEIRAFGHLALTQLDSAPLHEGEVRVAMRAVSLNYRDLLLLEGSYNPRLALPAVPCSDMVGEVVEVGAGVQRVRLGDRVLGSFVQSWIAGRLSRAHQSTALASPLPGVLASERVFAQEGLVLAPEGLDDVGASTLPCAALTAWHALVDHGRLTAGESVLVQGTGGVSIFALQIARALGATVIATTGRSERVERLLSLGASHVVNYREDPAWGRSVRGLTQGAGVDHVVEVGGAGTLTQSLHAVGPGGNVFVIGILGGASEPFNVLPVLMNEVRLQGIFVGPRDSLEAMCKALSGNQIRPVVDSVFSFDGAPAAFERLRSGAHFGKVVIKGP